MRQTDEKIALIVLFNHRYDRNLPLLEEMYRERFTNRFYIVPFYDGELENVIPVYGRSIFFESYIAQAYNIIKNQGFDYFYIVADDMIINPAINENNILDFFELQAGESWIPHLRTLSEQPCFWLGNLLAYIYRTNQKYVEIEGELPDVEKANKLFEKHGLHNAMQLSRKGVFREFTLNISSMANKARLAIRILSWLKHPFSRSANLSYPLAASYSDTLLVSKETMPKFVHYCGVFGATSLFVEVAIPTALVLASEKRIKTEKDISKKGRSYWFATDNVFCENPQYTWNNLEKEYKNLDDMLDRFPEDAIYLHPVKLSKWKKK